MVIKIFLVNFFQYREGAATAGKEVSLPCSSDDLEEVLNEIGVATDEECFLLKWSCEIEGVCSCISEQTSLVELNRIAGVLEQLSPDERELLSALIEAQKPDTPQLLSLLESLSAYVLLPGIHEDAELGQYFAETFGSIVIPDHIKPYFDYRAYGYKMRKTIRGLYTSYGFLLFEKFKTERIVNL